MRLPRQRCGIELLGSAANADFSIHVSLGLDQLVPSQTTKRVDQALGTLKKIVDFACTQHDHVSFAKAWMLASRKVAHALDYDFKPVPPPMMAPLQRRLEERYQAHCLNIAG